MSATASQKVLLSAYACEPGKGSEPEVGWQWAIGLARRGHQVWVLTRANNRATIEAALPALQLPNLHFVYFDLTPWQRRLKPWIGVNLYYRLWQRGALATARSLHAEVQFQRAHHVTFVVIRHPSFLRRLGVPYTFGPVAGGDTIPRALMAGLPSRFRIEETARRFANWVLIRTPAVRETLAKADRIIVNSAQTAALVPPDFQSKVILRLAITSRPVAAMHAPRKSNTPFRALFVGRLVHLKGVHLAMRAVAVANRRGVSVRLTVVGGGPALVWLTEVARREHCADEVDFVPWQPRSSLHELYESHDALLFASLRDSGGMAVFEAMEHGLPVVGLRLGGVGQIINESCGCSIAPTTPAQVVDDMAQCIVTLATDATAYAAASLGALQRLSAFSQSQLFSDLGY